MVKNLLTKLYTIKELRSENSIELLVEDVRKRGTQIKIRDKENKLSDPDTRKIEINIELENIVYNNLEDMVYRMEMIYY